MNEKITDGIRKMIEKVTGCVFLRVAIFWVVAAVFLWVLMGWRA